MKAAASIPPTVVSFTVSHDQIITVEMTIAVITSRIRKSTRRFDVNMTFIIFPTLLPHLFQLTGNLLFHFFGQRTIIRDFWLFIRSS
ncbi:hypothetical protein ACLB1R_00505 [Escherichia coli]